MPKRLLNKRQRQRAPIIQLAASDKELWDSLSNYDYVIVAYEESAKSGDENAKTDRYFVQSSARQQNLSNFRTRRWADTAEITRAESQGAVICGLGPRILRTETAPFYFLSAVSVLTELVGSDQVTQFKTSLVFDFLQAGLTDWLLKDTFTEFNTLGVQEVIVLPSDLRRAKQLTERLRDPSRLCS